MSLGKEVKKKFIEHYNKEAEFYDEYRYSNPCQNFYSELQKEIVYSYLRGCSYVYEAGCGTGRFAIHLAKQGIKVLAMDSSKKMLKIARDKAKREGVSAMVKFEHGDIENIKHKNNSFDGVLSVAVLRHFPDIDKSIAELSRILKPGGVLVTDFLDKKIFLFYDIYKKIFGDWKKEEHFFKNYYRTLEEVKYVLERNGITLVEHKAIVKFPSHPLLCKLFDFEFFSSALKFYEDSINIGGVVTTKGIKKM